MEYDFSEVLSTPTKYVARQGVKNIPDRSVPKPYKLERSEVFVTWRDEAWQEMKYLFIYYGNAFYSNVPGYAEISNQHTRRVRGKIAGFMHFTEALVEFKGLQRQLWSILDQGLRTLTRRKGAHRLKDLVSRGTWKQTPELYLLWQFAIAPLVSQMNDTLEKFAKLGGTYYDRVSTGGDIDFDPKDFSTSGPHHRGYRNGKVRFTTVFKYTVNNEKKAMIKEFLGLNRPLTALWDLKGWSWAVDYFFNAGELIANLDGDSLTRDVEFLSHSVKRSIEVYEVADGWNLHRDPALRELQKKDAARYGYHLVLENNAGDFIAVKNSHVKAVELFSFERKIGDFPNNFLPEFRFKPKPGTFQFANLASAIAITLRSFEWSDKNFLTKPLKR